MRQMKLEVDQKVKFEVTRGFRRFIINGTIRDIHDGLCAVEGDDGQNFILQDVVLASVLIED
ncbi:hypothetical protein Bp8pS_029 [Bacillus phage vB_BpuM-BpSp]|nr:hypothetical protein Bp8pS_029 [Bacillus phage vB_BpuM-BpSp]